MSGARPPMAPTLALELRETIARWFVARSNAVQSSELILAALADLAAEQVAANPCDAQTKVAQRFIHDIFRGMRDVNRRSLGGIPVTIVKQ